MEEQQKKTPEVKPVEKKPAEKKQAEKKFEAKKVTIKKEEKKPMGIVQKVLITVICILVAFFILYLVHAVRNNSIIKGLDKKADAYTSSTNYHETVVTKYADGKEEKVEYYQNGRRQKMVTTTTENGKTTKVSLYNNGSRIDKFTETATKKTMKVGVSDKISMKIIDALDGSLFKTGIRSFIVGSKNGETDCYKISSLNTSVKNDLYIEKATGLLSKQVKDDSEVEVTYEFDSVTDKDFVEPDISKYDIER